MRSVMLIVGALSTLIRGALTTFDDVVTACVFPYTCSIAVEKFHDRLFVGMPTRLLDCCTLPPSCFVEHKDYSWLTYGTLGKLAYDLGLGKSAVLLNVSAS